MSNVPGTAARLYDRAVERPSLSLVVPMFNEQENVEHALAWAADALRRHAPDYELIVVDDASTDRSAELVERAAAADPHVRLVRNAANRGLGGSLRAGFAAATRDLVMYMDADTPFDPDEIGRAVRALELTRADMVAGYRHDRTIEGSRRALYSYCYNFIIGLFFGWPHRDINFSFKLMRRRMLDAIELRAEGSLIDAELVVKAKNLGFVIQQIGLDYFPRSRGRSTLSSPRVIAAMLRELVRLAPDMRHPRRRASQPAP